MDIAKIEISVTEIANNEISSKKDKSSKGKRILNLNPSTIRQGIILSEILSPPKGRRKGFERHDYKSINRR